jgi:hypothetical protein
VGAQEEYAELTYGRLSRKFGEDLSAGCGMLDTRLGENGEKFKVDCL